MVYEEVEKENETILDVEEKGVESNPTLEDVPSIVSQIHYYACNCPNLKIR